MSLLPWPLPELSHIKGEAGHYEVHVSIDVGGVVSSGEFELPVLAPESEDGGQPENGGGHGSH